MILIPIPAKIDFYTLLESIPGTGIDFQNQIFILDMISIPAV